MTEKARRTIIDSLDEAMRPVAEAILDWCAAEFAESLRRSAGNAHSITELNLRLDRYEQGMLDAVTEKLIEFADAQLPEEERKKLIAVLYEVAAHAEDHERRIRTLERKVGERFQQEPGDEEGGGGGTV